MKIIGVCEVPDRYIVTATKQELAQVMGHPYGGYGECPPIQVGATIPVTEAYEALSQIRAIMQHIDPIRKAATALITVMGARLEHLNPVIEKAQKEVKK